MTPFRSGFLLGILAALFGNFAGLSGIFARESFAADALPPNLVAAAAAPLGLVQANALNLFQITAFNFDWDDNVFNMPTKIGIFANDTNQERLVSTAEFALIRSRIGVKGDEFENMHIDPDPLHGSFRFFRDAPVVEGVERNYFLESIELALASGDLSWQGPSWGQFKEALNDPRSALWTTIITARGHSPRHMLEGLALLQSQGYFRYLPPEENLYGISGDAYKGSAADPSGAKTAIMKSQLDRVEAFAINERMLDVLNREGTGAQKMNLWGFSDDDFGNYSRAVTDLGDAVKVGRWPDVKISLFFTGLKQPGIPPHSRVMLPTGALRPHAPGECQESLLIKAHS